MEPDLHSIQFRPAVAEDDVRIVAIHNLYEGDALPLTVARCRLEYAGEGAEHRGGRYVAMLDGDVVGSGCFRRAWWTAQPTIYSLDLRVDPGHLHRGIGTGLFALIHSQLLLRGATRIVLWIAEAGAEGRRFAKRLDFYETGQVLQEYSLPISEANTEAYTAITARLQSKGVRIVSLAELGQTDLGFLRSLQRLWAGSEDDTSAPDQPHDPFEVWQRQVLDAPGQSPDTHWIALEGGRPVGMTFLNRLSDDAFENDFTTVASTHRRRGIATALKRHAILWAQQQGVRCFYTSSEIGNTSMITVNTRLGYRPGAVQVELARDIS